MAIIDLFTLRRVSFFMLFLACLFAGLETLHDGPLLYGSIECMIFGSGIGFFGWYCYLWIKKHWNFKSGTTVNSDGTIEWKRTLDSL